MSGVCGVSVGAGAVRIAYIADGRRVEDSIDAAGAHDLLPGKLLDHGPFEDIVLAGWDTAAVTALLDTLGDRTVPQARMVEESQALMAYARTVRELADKDYVLVVDLGKKGLSATALDVAGDVVEWTARSVDISGDRFDEVVRGIVMAKGILPAPVGPEGDEEYQAFFRELKELVSSSMGVRAPNRGPMLLSRKEFELEISPLVSDALDWASKQTPDAVLLIGGGAAIPAVRTIIEDKWDVPVHVPDAPAMAVATGAALDVSPFAAAELGGSGTDTVVVPDDASTLFDSEAPGIVEDAATGIVDGAALEGLAVDQLAFESLAIDPTALTDEPSATQLGSGVLDSNVVDSNVLGPHVTDTGWLDQDSLLDATMSDAELLDRTGFGVPSSDPGIDPSRVRRAAAIPARGRVRWPVRDAALLVGALSLAAVVWGLVYTRGDTPPPPSIASTAIYDDPSLAPSLPVVQVPVAAPIEGRPAGPYALSSADLYEREFSYVGEKYQPTASDSEETDVGFG